MNTHAGPPRSDNLTNVIDERVRVYGDPTVTFPQIAQIWSGITGFDITPEMVPLMMIGYKLNRAVQAPDYSDNSDDVEGYLDIFRKVVNSDPAYPMGMIHARSVDEYVTKKHGGS